MTDLRTAAQQALEALEKVKYGLWEEDSREGRALITALRAALEQPEPWVKSYCGGKPNYTAPTEQEPKFTLSCGCPSQYGGVPAYWDRDGSIAFGMICEKHWHEYGARSEA
jgi:hypothetical protein